MVEHIGDGVARLDHDLAHGAGSEIAAIGAGAEGGDGSAGDRGQRPIERRLRKFPRRGRNLAGLRESITQAVYLTRWKSSEKLRMVPA